MRFELFGEYFPDLLSGIPMMLQLAGLSLFLGFFLAVLLAVLRTSGIRPLEWFVRGYVYVFRGTPLLVQIFLIYYGTGQFDLIKQSFLWPVLREAYWCAIIALTLNTGAYTSEIIRGGIEAVPWGQVEAAKACGMSAWLRFRRVVFPQAIRQALPGYGNEIILMIKSTSLASTITLLEVTGIARKIISQTYAPLELFVMAGAIYLTIVFTVTRIVDWIENRLSPELAGRRHVEDAEKDLASVH
ncbi:nopaline transport system permease protein NocM [Thalassobaculum fulvum]|jgi:octopine/nopaline transport system permease protein|uniref:Nopaline transport system permease protein NocM n=1 Tax=Thalassobaculum fulvum TaxID=1633335 RepID=A0A918XNU9_9PROT|nr:ABC transporter permease [Thalassobaculum fulvum]GHD42960.1 nopaline transport system permease protein NocM [Thalassobaculum fulvum]